MKNISIFLIITFFIRINSQIKENPKFLVEAKNLLLLSSNNDYYYAIASNKIFKINKESGSHVIINDDNIYNIIDYNYFASNAYNNYLFKHLNNQLTSLKYTFNFEYYQIIYSSSISFQNITDRYGKNTCFYEMIPVDGIAKDNEFFIYGYSPDSGNLLFIKISGSGCGASPIDKINEKLSCKIIGNEFFVCATIISSNLEVLCFRFYSVFREEALTRLANSNPLFYNSISSFGLYNTDDDYVKLLCRQNSQLIQCEFFKIILLPQISVPFYKNDFSLLGNEKISFTATNNFSEKNCYLSQFISEYLFCCAIDNYIECYRINRTTYNPIKKFKIFIEGDNSYLTIKSNSNYLTFFFINYLNNKYSVYEYYIYEPSCQNKNFEISNNNFNDNSMEENRGKLSNFFTVKTNKYYFEIKNSSNEYGYFTLNDQILNGKIIISNNNYNLDFIVTNNGIIKNAIINANYIVSVEDEEAYSKKCKLILNFKNCYKSCETCSVGVGGSNENQHNCITCWDKYYLSPENNNNCYSIDEKKKNWYFDSNTLKFGFCHEECKTCSGPNNFNCTSCNNGLYLDKGYCTNQCSPENFPMGIQNDEDDYFLCRECHQNCQTCSNSKIFTGMNCETCKENQIKYNDNCYEIYDSSKKIFSVPNDSDINNQLSSCFQKFGLYIKEDFKECIPFPNEDEGYYLSNSETGLLSKCYANCLSCYQGPVRDNAGIIQSMECSKCKDSSITNKKMIKVDNNCFKSINYSENSITFDISEINPNNAVGTCKSFGKAIYYGENNCVNKPENSYFVLKNSRDTGVIKNFIENDIFELINEFKNEIKNDINSFKNKSRAINGSNFLSVFLNSNNLDPETQFKNGVSAVDLGNCTNILKEHYKIPKEEELIIMNMELKNDENQKNKRDDDNASILGKRTLLEVFDYSGKMLNLSICKEDIKIMNYIGDVKELDINSAKYLSGKGIDVFNANDDFFNDICHHYDFPDGKDIIINDRRNDFYQNASFCQDGCIYDGINYTLMVANCICKPNKLQEIKKNITEFVEKIEFINFKTIKKAFLENLFSFNYEVLRCYNLVFNTKILLSNIGFYCLMSMFTLQIIYVFVYLLKKLNSIKNFLLKFENKKYNKNNVKNKRNINIINNKGFKNNHNKNDSNKKFLATPPQRNKNQIKSPDNSSKKISLLNKTKNNNINKNNKFQPSNKLKVKAFYKFNPKQNSYISKNLDNNIRIHNIYNKNNFGLKNNSYKHKKIIKDFKGKGIKFININNNNYFYNIEKSKLNKNLTNKHSNRLFKNINDLNEMNYEEAILYDKRGYLKIYWEFLVDSQIILVTFCTDNYLDLFIIKLSFFICNFQISSFLNTFFYTDKFISDSYHNDGVLDFISGLPKSIYSFIATLITTNLLRMLSTSKSELINLIKVNRMHNNYAHLINVKLIKLRNKLIIYFIIVYILSLFFLYYVTAFCAVYRNSQKYLFFGCLESFGMDCLVAFVICIFLALFRLISIKKHIKCFYILANIINAFL